MINYKMVLLYCSEDISLIENYAEAVADETITWHCHHRLEIDKNYTAQELKNNNLLYHRPAEELIFLTPKDHMSLHSSNRSEETRLKLSKATLGKKHSEESIKKMSLAKKGKKFTEEHKAKLSAAHKGVVISEEHRKRLSELRKGKHIIIDPSTGKRKWVI